MSVRPDESCAQKSGKGVSPSSRIRIQSGFRILRLHDLFSFLENKPASMEIAERF
jgi:hypothetical protein